MTDTANLHGSAPDKSPVALLMIDVINDMEFEGAEDLLEYALPMARQIADLKQRAVEAKVPCVYVNDNFGRWRSDFHQTVDHVLSDEVRGQPLAELLPPSEEDYFVLKPKHSGFFDTTLDLLLKHLGAKTLVLTGLAANICVLATAADAYMRNYHIVVPHDCVASESRALNDHALEHMRLVLKAETPPAAEIDFAALVAEASKAEQN